MTHPQHLERYSPAIARVLARWPDSSVREVLDAVAQGTAQLFEAGPNGVIVTRLIEEPTRLVCLVWLASGDLDRLLERYADVESWARSHEVDTMRIQGRAGWLRVLDGFSQVGVILEKGLG